jgi:hypothetical protein
METKTRRTTMSKYNVKNGQNEVVESFDDLNDALALCWDLASKQSYDEYDANYDIEEDETQLAEYNNGDVKWGVCPANDDGAYWPCVVVA